MHFGFNTGLAIAFIICIVFYFVGFFACLRRFAFAHTCLFTSLLAGLFTIFVCFLSVVFSQLPIYGFLLFIACLYTLAAYLWLKDLSPKVSEKGSGLKV